MQKIKDKSAGEMLSATMKVFRDSKEFGPLKVLSITYDNGTENANHELVNRMLNCKSFFCAPYHSWEKGQIENRRHNKLISRTDEVEKLTGREPIENFQRSIIYNCLNFMDFFVRDQVKIRAFYPFKIFFY